MLHQDRRTSGNFFSDGCMSENDTDATVWHKKIYTQHTSDQSRGSLFNIQVF